MRVNLVGLCVVCMGKGIFLSKKCSECSGRGGKIISCSQEVKERFMQDEGLFSEQEKALFENYSKAFSQDEIARNLDIPLSKVINILYSIEQKLNR